MATKDIKVGNFYHVLVKVLGINPTNGEITTETANEFGTSLNMEPTYFARCEKEAFFPITPENGVKNSEPAPKYAPCRKFRKGDKVEYHPKDGRELFEAKRLLAQTLTVVENEHKEFNRVTVEAQNGDTLSVPFYYLKLVTPVEEFEPYSLEHRPSEWLVVKKANNLILSSYNVGIHPNAKAAAETECARLNEAYRKELK